MSITTGPQQHQNANNSMSAKNQPAIIWILTKLGTPTKIQILHCLNASWSKKNFCRGLGGLKGKVAPKVARDMLFFSPKHVQYFLVVNWYFLNVILHSSTKTEALSGYYEITYSFCKYSIRLFVFVCPTQSPLRWSDCPGKYACSVYS